MNYHRPAETDHALGDIMCRACAWAVHGLCSPKKMFFCFFPIFLIYIFIFNFLCLHKGFFQCISDAYKGPPPPAIFHWHQTPPQKLLTLFTTFTATKDKDTIHRNTLRNWAQLRNRTRLIYYHTNETTPMAGEIREYAKHLGWEVRVTPKLRNEIPVLRHMFLDAQNLSNTPYYAYANGDILFTDNLITTLEGIYDYQLPSVLMVGQRTNIHLSKKEEITTASQVMRLAKMNGSLMISHAEDYFISTKDGYPWQQIPDFVVGRIGYDNWLVVTAILRDIPVLDLTKTLLAVHQTDNHGNYEGHANKTKEDRYLNYKLVERHFNFGLGLTRCSHFFSIHNGTSVLLAPRYKNPCYGLYKRKRKNPYLYRYSIREFVPQTTTAFITEGDFDEPYTPDLP